MSTGAFGLSTDKAPRGGGSGRMRSMVAMDDDDDDDDVQPAREEIASIEGNAIHSVNAQLSTRATGPKVIPMLNNPNPVPYRKKLSNIAAIAQSGQSAITEKFSIENMEVSGDAEPKKETVYGLVIRKADGEETSTDVKVESCAPTPTPSSTELLDMPLLLRNRNAALDHITDEEEKFKADVAARPDEAAPEAYTSMPVEDYGEALMRGMGWAPGAPIGLSNPSVVLPIEFVPRHHRLGLGATPKAPDAKDKERDAKKIIKPGESREPKPMMVVPRDADGHQRHYRTLDEKLVPFQASSVLVPGAAVSMVGGVHEGVQGRLSALQGERASVKLANGEEVQVLSSHLVAASRTPASKRKADEAIASTSTPTPPSSSSTSGGSLSGWVRPGLLVKIVSKSWKEGRYYQKKARVLDVPCAGESTVRLADDGRLLEHVPERALQTVLPRTGERVLVLRGSQTGKSATLVQLDDRREEAVVQMADELDLRTYLYDEVCAFTISDT